MTKQRLPLSLPLEPRDSIQTKDSLLTNTFIDVDVDKLEYVTKRPGFLLGVGGVTNGTNYGVYINPNTNSFYYVNNKGVPILGTPPNYWNNSTTYGLGSSVIYRGQIWTSLISSNTNIIPACGTNWNASTCTPRPTTRNTMSFDYTFLETLPSGGLVSWIVQTDISDISPFKVLVFNYQHGFNNVPLLNVYLTLNDLPAGPGASVLIPITLPNSGYVDITPVGTLYLVYLNGEFLTSFNYYEIGQLGDPGFFNNSAGGANSNINVTNLIVY